MNLKHYTLSLLFAGAAFLASAQTSVTIVNADTTIFNGASFNLYTTVDFPALTSNEPSLTLNPNLVVPDSDLIIGVSSTLDVVAPGIMANQLISINVNIPTTWNSDVVAYLIAPDASQILLTSDNGGSGDGYVNCVFTNNIADPSVTTAPAPGIISGNYAPEEPFSNLTGAMTGTWTLRVFDDAGGDQTILQDWTITFPEANEIISYTWTPATGLDNATSASPIASPTVTTTYTVTVEDLDGAIAMDMITVTVVEDPSSSISELNANAFNVYPNPAKNNVTVSNLDANHSVQVIDLTGKTVLTSKTGNLSVGHLVDGVYFVQISSNSKIVATEKLVVRK